MTCMPRRCRTGTGCRQRLCTAHISWWLHVHRCKGPGMRRGFMADKSLPVVRARFVPSWNNAHLDPVSLSSPCTACMRLCLPSR
jgi:hypothetical protein